MAKERLDIKQHVTDTIIAQIEAGTPPWRSPWTGSAMGGGFPLRHNGEQYRGVNILMLWAVGMERGYTSDRWMTFKQARDLGGMVRKGEKCARSVYYGTYERDVDTGNGDTETRTSAFAKCNNVFNADQIDGLPEDYYIQPDLPRDMGTTTNAEIEVVFAKTGATIRTTEKPSAYYDIVSDHIHMPPVATFHSQEGYFATLAHELVHWTGHKSRLDRFEKFKKRSDLAFEELVAEIGSCFLCLHLGVEPEFGQSAAYVENWLTALKSDKTMIFRAAAEAQRAVDHIIGLTDDVPLQEAA